MLIFFSKFWVCLGIQRHTPGAAPDLVMYHSGNRLRPNGNNCSLQKTFCTWGVILTHLWSFGGPVMFLQSWWWGEEAHAYNCSSDHFWTIMLPITSIPFPHSPSPIPDGFNMPSFGAPGAQGHGGASERLGIPRFSKIDFPSYDQIEAGE